MLEIAGERVFFGDFHGQWNEKASTLPLLVAGLTYYGYDFTMFQGPGDTGIDSPLQRLVRDLEVGLNVYPNGKELMYGWGHLATAGLDKPERLPPLDAPDFMTVLRHVRGHAAFVTLAHPYKEMRDKLDTLLDEGLVDAIELVNADGADDREPFLLKWYEERLRRGRLTPIVSGLDIHTASGCQRPPVLYLPDNPPADDIPLLNLHRTVTLCESAEAECVFDAVRKGRSLIEWKNRLIGPPALVEKLTKGNYFDKRAKAQAAREELRLKTDSAPVAGEPLRLHVLTPHADGGAAIFHDTTGTSTHLRYETDGTVTLARPPILCDDDIAYAPINIRPDSGGGRLFAVKTRSPLSVGFRAVTSLGSGSSRHDKVALGIRNNGSKPAHGTYRVRCEEDQTWISEGRFGPITPLATAHVDCGAAPRGDPHKARPFSAEIMMDGGLTQTCRRRLVFLAIPRSDTLSEADWRGCAPISVNRSELLDPGMTSRWDGPEDASADVRILWNADGLHFRIEAVDDVLCPSPRREQFMFGDSIQMGLNPIEREDVPCFSFYDILLTRGADGDDERCWIRTAPRLAVEMIEKQGLYLPPSCFSVSRIDPTRTLLRLDLPWSVLVPMQPLTGYRFGLYFYLFDNDGTGLKSALAWPSPSRCWYTPEGAGWAQAVLDG